MTEQKPKKAPHGGARAGAGRPAKPKPPTGPAGELTPLDWLLTVMRDPDATAARRMRAAIAAMPFCHAKPAPGGKKDQARADAAKATGGRFRPGAAPLALVGPK